MTTSSHPPSPAGPTPAAPRRRRTDGLLVSAVVLLVLALATAGAGVVIFLRTLPFDVLATDGSDGSGVLGSVTIPGDGQVTLEPGTYDVWLAVPATSDPEQVGGRLEVTGPDGVPVALGAAGSTGNVTMGGTKARLELGFEAEQQGTYRLAASASAAPEGSRLLVTTDTSTGDLVGGVFGTIGLAFAALALGGVGVGLLVAALVRRHRRRSREAGPGGGRPGGGPAGGPPGGYPGQYGGQPYPGVPGGGYPGGPGGGYAGGPGYPGGRPRPDGGALPPQEL